MASQKILVVEDFKDLRELVTLCLRSRGFDVLEAATGRVAIQTAITERPNFILLDLRLPDVNGIEVARELRKLPETEHIPVVAWAGAWSKPSEEVLRCAGIVEYLQKPVSMRELESVIERVRLKTQASPVLD